MTDKISLNVNILASIVAGEKLADAELSIYNHSKLGRQAEQAAKVLTKALTKAISENNLDVLFILERQAIERDITCYGAEEKRSGALGGLDQTAQLVRSTSTVEGARKYLISMNGGKELPTKIPSTDLVQNFIKNRKAELTQMIGGTSSPALKTYHLRRKEAQEYIRKEYVKNLNRGLGKEIENDRGLSR